jgi:hypothetical protein
VEGVQLRQVTLPKGERGGLLTQASFLTASANGVDTSPVVRGVYVQEKLLGYWSPPRNTGRKPGSCSVHGAAFWKTFSMARLRPIKR